MYSKHGFIEDLLDTKILTSRIFHPGRFESSQYHAVTSTSSVQAEHLRGLEVLGSGEQ